MSNDLYSDIYNPDVLTCLANLSNDEVFTPPDVANAMLDQLPQELFGDPNTKFLDPACKSGIFLREIAKRLLTGLEPLIPDLQQRVDHIFHHQIYGIAITELTSLLSRRSVYCSKYPNSVYSVSHFGDAEGNIRYKRIAHRWKGGKCVFCGAAQSQYDRDDVLETHAYELIHTTKPEDIFKMKFDVIISNPPYQLSDGGNGASAKPIFHKFIESAKKMSPAYITMIVPARWYAGGKGLDEFRADMLNDTHLKTIIDYPNPKECFPGLNVSGGVCYFLWEKRYQGKCSFTNVVKGAETTSLRDMNEFNLFIRYNQAVSIIHKVIAHHEPMLETIISSRKPFGLGSFVRGHEKKNKNDLTLVSSAGRSYIEKGEITQGTDLIDRYKVIIGKALSGHIGETDENGQVKVLAKVELLAPGEVCTESYLCVGNFQTKERGIYLEQYLKTKFVRFLLLQVLTSMNITKDKFCFVPIQDFSKPWTDAELYAKYGLTDEEIAFIESMIRPMDLTGGDD